MTEDIVRSCLKKCCEPKRRPMRKTQTILQNEQQADLLKKLQEYDESEFEVRLTKDKGRGVFTRRTFERGEFVLELTGELISVKEGGQREARYHDSTRCYMVYFKHAFKSYCLDASEENDRLGRLVNHSRRNCNLKAKVMIVDNVPRLLLIANKTIETNQELLYDYGDRNPESLRQFPWLAQ